MILSVSPIDSHIVNVTMTMPVTAHVTCVTFFVTYIVSVTMLVTAHVTYVIMVVTYIVTVTMPVTHTCPCHVCGHCRDLDCDDKCDRCLDRDRDLTVRRHAAIEKKANQISNMDRERPHAAIDLTHISKSCH